MRFGVSVLFAVLVAGILAAQAPAPQKPTFRTGVNYVRVDVYPTLGGGAVGDLAKVDFEVLEDGVPQSIDTFDHIVVRPREVTSERVEPKDLRESMQMAADARNRLFVLFLDTYHVTESSVSHSATPGMAGSTTVRTPPQKHPLGTRPIDIALRNFLERTVAPTDLFASLTPEMDVEQLTFTRRPDNFEDLVKTVWGRRYNSDDWDPEENRWGYCYPSEDPCYTGVLKEMVARRRENQTLQALGLLVRRLGDLREERKAVLLVSEGWPLYRPDRRLARPLPHPAHPPGNCSPMIATGKGVSVGPGGQLMLGTDPRTYNTVDWQQCETSRTSLAALDNYRTYRELMDAANRTNSTFYPIDPRGLAVLSAPYNYRDFANTPADMKTLAADKDINADAADLREHLAALEQLATATDGSMTSTNNLDAGLKKISDDLSDYYLLGYYSTNVKTDGTFRKITVRVKRAGVTVRARRGYLAASASEVAALAAASARVDPEASSRTTALDALGAIRSDRLFHLAAGTAGAGAANAQMSAPLLWVTGEMDSTALRQEGWTSGADASIAVIDKDGKTVATERRQLAPASRAFLLQIANALPPGEYIVRARVQGKAGTGAETTEQTRVTVPTGANSNGVVSGQSLMFRRGPYTGPSFQPTADVRFHRAERVRVEVPVAGGIQASDVSARLLDRKGQELPIPASVGERTDGSVKFATAEINLAPLAPGDYLVELAVRKGDSREKCLAAIRIVP